jgi:signal transduction histidine kinase
MNTRQTLSLDPHLDLSLLCMATIENSPLPMAAVDGLTHILRYGNPSFCHLMRKPLEQLVGKPLHELLPAQDVCVALLDRVLKTGKPEAHVQQEISETQPIFWSYTMWPVQADEPIVGVMIQVTETAKLHGQTLAMNEALTLGAVRQHELREAADRLNAQLLHEMDVRKQAQQELQRAQELLVDRAAQLEGAVLQRTAELTATTKQMEAFIYSVAHDLRAPLRSMQGFSTMLLEDEETVLSNLGKEYATRIVASAQQMDRLLLDLLAFSRVAQQSVHLTSVDLGEVIAEVVSALEVNIKAKSARVETPGPWPRVAAHAPTLNQVLTNLVGNALKFADPGVPPKVRLWAEEKGEVVRVWVEDNGIGISPNHQHQIFKLFTRVHGEQYPGTGIGLAIVEKGIERMGGHTGVESTAGSGARFWFELGKAD